MIWSCFDIGLRRIGQDIEDGRHRPGKDEYTCQTGRTRNMKSLYKQDNRNLELYKKIGIYVDQTLRLKNPALATTEKC